MTKLNEEYYKKLGRKQNTKAVVFLCGLIGSGKTTYANENFRYVTDADNMHPFATKAEQVAWTERLLALDSVQVVCHITCFPRKEEVKAFKGFNKYFIWIDTTPEQCKKNILKRKRERDLDNFNSVLVANDKYLKQYCDTVLEFDEISLF